MASVPERFASCRRKPGACSQHSDPRLHSNPVPAQFVTVTIYRQAPDPGNDPWRNALAQISDRTADARHGCEMTSHKVPTPKEIKAAAQAAAETAQSVASGAMRIPPASIQLASQLPDLIENLAIATERLNNAIDRAERYLALADPMIRTMDALLPQLEALVATGNDVYNAVSSIPGASTLGRLATGGVRPAAKKSARPRATQKKS